MKTIKLITTPMGKIKEVIMDVHDYQIERIGDTQSTKNVVITFEEVDYNLMKIGGDLLESFNESNNKEYSVIGDVGYKLFELINDEYVLIDEHNCGNVY